MSERQLVECKTSLFDILRERYMFMPSDIAYTWLNEDGCKDSVTFAQLYHNVLRTAYKMEKSGLKHGDRCILMFSQGIPFIESFLACNLHGVIAIPLNIPSKSRGLDKWEKIATDARCNHIYTEERQKKSLQEIFAKSTTMQHLKIYTGDDGRNQEPIAVEPLQGKPENICFLQYTSGSTGMPKGVIITNDCLLSNLKQLQKRLAFDSNTVAVSWLPYYHDMGLIMGILLGLYNGHHVVLMHPVSFVQNPRMWLDAISDYRGTHVAAPNFAFEAVAKRLQEMKPGEVDLSSLKRVACGAEPIHVNTLIHFQRAAERFGLKKNCLCPGYGLAENTLVVSALEDLQPVRWMRISRNALKKNKIEVIERGTFDPLPEFFDQTNAENTVLVGNGSVIFGHQVVIRNPSGQALKPLEIGEICCEGPSLSKGYWEKGEETKRAYIEDGDVRYFRTGDMGFLDYNGDIYITGRIKDIIIIRGMNFYPQDLERAAFMSDPALRKDGAAAFYEVKDQEEKITIIQEIERHCVRTANCEELAAKIRKQMAKTYGVVPETIVFVPPMHVPRTTSGKIQRKLAKEMYIKGELGKIICVSKRLTHADEIHQTIDSEQAILEFIKKLLAKELGVNENEVDSHRSFMEIGINSMMSMNMKESLEQKLNLAILPTTLFNYNTAKRLSEYLWNQTLNKE